MCAQYVLKAGNFTAPGGTAPIDKQVGPTYNLALSDGTVYYGYLLKPDATQGLIEKTDVATRDALVNYGSPNLVDRDLTYFPRVSQGDFSGGGLQVVFLSPNQYWDSDLDISQPGVLKLRQQVTTASISVTSTTASIVAAQGQFWVGRSGASNLVLYNFTNPSSITSNTTTISPAYLSTDGYGVYYSDGSQIARWVSSETIVANTVQGTLGGLWVVQNGSGQYFAYYVNTTPTPQALWRVDLSNTGAFPIAAGSHVQVPTGGLQVTFVQVVGYQNGIAILTTDSATTPTGGDVWFHDGSALTHIVRIDGYRMRGLVNCLGDLYITADQAASTSGGSILARVSGGTYQIVAAPTPITALPALNSVPLLSQPATSGGRVFAYVKLSTQSGIVGDYVLIYDSSTGSTSHGPSVGGQGVLDRASTGLCVAATGSSVATVVVGPSGNSFPRISAQALAGANYQTSGWLCSSKIDLATPSIEKRFRTVQIYHAPLRSGEQVLVNVFVDQEPLLWTTASSPVPSTATVNNTTVGSTSTVATMGAGGMVGRTMFYAMKLTGPNTTTPNVNYAAVEVGGTWTWELELDCTSKRRPLPQNQEQDPQGVTGKDLYFLIRNAYENGTLLTLYLAQSVSYTVTIESIEARSIPYAEHPDPPAVKPDEEWWVKTILRQVV